MTIIRCVRCKTITVDWQCVGFNMSKYKQGLIHDTIDAPCVLCNDCGKVVKIVEKNGEVFLVARKPKDKAEVKKFMEELK